MNGIGAKVTHIKYGDGIVKDIKGGSKGTTTLVIDFNSIEKLFSYPICGDKGTIVTDDKDLVAIYEKSINDVKEYNDKIEEELRQRLLEKEELERRIMEFKKYKSEKRTKKTVKVNTEDWDDDTFKMFHSTIIKDVEFDSDYNKFYAIGFIAAHVQNIIADMSDDRESDFVSIFGDVERNVLDYNDERSVCQLNIEFDKKTVFPEVLYDAVCEVKYGKAYNIPRSKFVFDLVKKYGFSFGERQNVADIYEKVDALGYGKAFTDGFNF